MLTPEEAADFLSVSPATVRDWARRKIIPGEKFGKVWRFTEEGLRRAGTAEYGASIKRTLGRKSHATVWETTEAQAYFRAKYANRVPAWADRKKIKSVYQECHRLNCSQWAPLVVDHIIPLRGKAVSGLHVENNLRVIPATANRAKGNRHDC